MKSLHLTCRNTGYMIQLGASAMLGELAIACMMLVGNYAFIRMLKEDGVAAYSVACYCLPIVFMIANAIAQSAQPIISYNYGAKNVDRVKSAFKLLLKVSLTYSVFLWLCVMIFPQVFAGMFTSDATLLAFTAKALRIYLACLFMFGIQIACQMTFVSIGNAPCSIIVAILRKFVLLIPLIFILPHILPDRTMAVYTAEPVADTLAVIFTMVMFGTQFRKALKKLEEA